MYCFDTNIVVDIFRGDKDLKIKIEHLIDSMAEIYITPITLCELYKGAYLHHNSLEKLKELDDFLSSFDLLDFNGQACQEFGREYVRLSKIGKMTGEFDLMIASIAKAHNLIIVTRDKKHFGNLDVKVEAW